MKTTAFSEKIVKWRRDLHKIPEVGLDTYKTSSYIQSELSKMGIPYDTYVNDAAVVARIGNMDGRVIAYRADIDGLQISEETGLLYASENGNMHACGHDAHAVIALGIASKLKEKEGQLNGGVLILFQPAEENLLGAKAMLEEGVFASVKPEKILALHTGALPQIPNGSIVLPRKVVTASSDAFVIQVNGKGGHAAYPEQCIDPTPVAALIAEALQLIVSREIAPSSPAVLTISGIQSGNDAYNIIPDQAILRGTIRTQDEEVRKNMKKRVKEIAEGIGSALHAECKVEILDGVPTMKNDPAILDVIQEEYEKIPGHRQVMLNPPVVMGGEDAACFFEQVPGAYIMLVTTKENGGKIYPSHNSRYDVDDTCLYIAADLMVNTVETLLQQP